MYLKKSVFFLLLCITHTLTAQSFDFFIDKTLCIHYLHSGNFNEEFYQIDSYHAGGKWHGTREHLTSPYQYGSLMFQVYDSLTGQLLFSKSYSSLFEEYRATTEAKTQSASFEECVIMPFPKQTVRCVFSSISRNNEEIKGYTFYFNPQKDHYSAFKTEYKTQNLHKGGASRNCLDILFIPDGYAKSDQKKLKKDMKRFASYILNCSPYKEYKQKINIRSIEAYSDESGITDPLKDIVKNTLLASSYNTLESDRYLMTLNVWKLYEVAGEAPYDALVVICNSPKYGGGGIYNFYASVNSDNQNSDFVLVHELGHSIGGLGDEYYTSDVSVEDFYSEEIEPLEPNLTTLTHFEDKWKSMVSTDTPIPTPDIKQYDGIIGVFEGGGYAAKGVYRPVRSCTMKDIIYDKFCPVCNNSLINIINYYSN